MARFDHVGLTVTDLDRSTAFFTALGLEPDGDPWVVEGPFLDTVCGMTGARVRGAMLELPGAGTRVELSQFLEPVVSFAPESPSATVPGLRNVCLEVEDLQAVVERAGATAGRPSRAAGR